MSITAIVTSVFKNGFNAVATVEFFDDITNETIIENIPGNDLSVETLAFRCQRIAELIEARNVALENIQTGPIVFPRDAKSGPLADKVQAIAAADAFFNKVAVLTALKTQVDKGIIKPDNPAIPEAEAAVKSTFLPEYASDPRFR